jgi:hypothetical protein
VKNCIIWCHSMMTLCLFFNPVSRSLLLTDSPTVHKLSMRVFSTNYFHPWFHR